jgi:branched-subunit amino acid aminotransferase/4-amino-4-deoxychorismate lyase
MKFPNAADLKRGITLFSLPLPLGGKEWGIKVGNYAPHVQALQEARLLGAEEGIVCNGQGNILSCAMGNILVWMPGSRKNGVPMLCTPTAGEDVRTGAVLSWVCRHTPVLERKLRPADLHRAVALAVTNSRLGVMPVAMADGRVLPDQARALTLAREYLRKLIPES